MLFEQELDIDITKEKLLTLSWQSSLSHRNQSIALQIKSMDWSLYDRDLRHERVMDQKIRTRKNSVFGHISHSDTSG